MSVNINFRITDAGQSAVFSATGTGTSLNLTHVQVGSGKRTPTGSETALVTPIAVVPIGYGIKISPTQIRMMATFTGSSTFDIYEVGIWSGAPGSAGAVLVCYYSHLTDKLTSKFADVDFVFLHDMVISGILPGDSLNIIYDDNAALMVVAVTDHISGVDPHPQYLNNARGDVRYSPKTHSHTIEEITGTESSIPLRITTLTLPLSGTFTKLPNATRMKLQMLGGGGGGACSTSNWGTPVEYINGGGGGGGGGYVETGFLTAANFTYSIGAGGAGAVESYQCSNYVNAGSSNVPATNGGNTTASITTVYAQGGGAGININGGSGGGAVGGATVKIGEKGESANSTVSGNGGNSLYGSGGVGSAATPSLTVTGGGAYGPGGGGGGARGTMSTNCAYAENYYSSSAAGHGAAGLIIVTEY
jgi:hypothetical protein